MVNTYTYTLRAGYSIGSTNGPFFGKSSAEIDPLVARLSTSTQLELMFSRHSTQNTQSAIAAHTRDKQVQKEILLAAAEKTENSRYVENCRNSVVEWLASNRNIDEPEQAAIRLLCEERLIGNAKFELAKNRSITLDSQIYIAKFEVFSPASPNGMAQLMLATNPVIDVSVMRMLLEAERGGRCGIYYRHYPKFVRAALASNRSVLAYEDVCDRLDKDPEPSVREAFARTIEQDAEQTLTIQRFIDEHKTP